MLARKRKSNFVLLVLLLVVTALGVVSVNQAAEAQVKVAAIVNDDAITTVDIGDRLKLAMFSSRLPQTDEVKQKLIPQILQLLIDERLLNQEAKKFDINVSEADLDFSISSLEKKNNIPQGQFVKFLQENGINTDSFKDQLKSQIVKTKIINNKIRSGIVVSEGEIDERLENIAANGGGADYDISEIVIAVDKPEDEQKAADTAFNLVKQIRGKGDFAKIAKEFSRSTSSENGGKIGWKNQNDLNEDMVSALKKIKTGDVTDPIRTADGYYILKLNDIRAVLAGGKGETEVGLKQAFVPITDKKNLTVNDKIVANINEARKELKGCDSFTKFSNNIDSVISPEMVRTPQSSLNEDVRKIVARLDVGKASDIVKSDSGLHIFMVCERAKSEAGFAERGKIAELISAEKTEMQVKRYLRDLRRNSFIEIRL